MQRREIDLGVIYILGREQVLRADELREDRWRGKAENPVPGDPARGREAGDDVPAGFEWGPTSQSPGSAQTWARAEAPTRRSPSHRCQKHPEDTGSVISKYVFSLTRTRLCFLNNYRWWVC